MQVSLPTNEPYNVRNVIQNEHGLRITSGFIERDGVDEQATVVEWFSEGKVDITIKGLDYEEYYV